MYEVMGDLHKNRMLDSQTMQTTNGLSYMTNNSHHIKADRADSNDTDSYTPHYFRSHTNRAADQRENQVLTKKIYNQYIDVFSRNCLF